MKLKLRFKVKVAIKRIKILLPIPTISITKRLKETPKSKLPIGKWKI